jgi:hypothetical protein
MPDVESMTAGQKPRSNAWQDAIIVVQEAEPPFIPAGAHAMTAVVEFPPGDPGNRPHRHSGPCFGYVLEGEMVFELDGDPGVSSGLARRSGSPVATSSTIRTATAATTSQCVSPSPCSANQASMLTLVDEEELVRRENRKAPRTN